MNHMSHKTESLADLLARWMSRAGFADNVKGRTQAGERLGFSHQALANYLAGHLPHVNRIAGLAAAMGIGVAKLRQVIARDRAGLHPNNDANAASCATAAVPT